MELCGAPSEQCHHLAGPATHSLGPGSALGPLCLLTQGHLPPADWDELLLMDVKVTEHFCLVTENEMASERGQELLLRHAGACGKEKAEN